MEEQPRLPAKRHFSWLRDRALRLVVEKDLPELVTWKGSAQLVGLWFVLLIGFAVTPVYVLLRLPFQHGGWRFMVMFVSFVLGVAFVALVMVFAAGMAGLGSIR